MKKIFACTSNDKHLKIIADFCQEERFTLMTFEEPPCAEGHKPILFITDKNMTGQNLVSKDVPVCVITDNIAGNCTYYLKESFQKYHLRMIIDNIYHGNLIYNYASSITPTTIHKEFKLSNDYDNIDKIVCAITVDLSFFFTFCDLEKIRVGISEMITNAIEHGNLSITNNEKMVSTENGTYYDLLEERLKDPKNINKLTHVIIDYSYNVLTIVIKDDGDGFDTSKIPDPTDSEQLLKLHGRGIFITRMYFNEITYNDKGNQVTMVKQNK